MKTPYEKGKVVSLGIYICKRRSTPSPDLPTSSLFLSSILTHRLDLVEVSLGTALARVVRKVWPNEVRKLRVDVEWARDLGYVRDVAVAVSTIEPEAALSLTASGARVKARSAAVGGFGR